MSINNVIHLSKSCLLIMSYIRNGRLRQEVCAICGWEGLIILYARVCSTVTAVSFKVVAVSQITGKKGTLKRKRQIRELVEHHDFGEDDDFFDSTPARKTKKTKVGSVTQKGVPKVQKKDGHA